MERINVLYLLGAGRSGTTLMATILNDHSQIQTIGEMHQFLEHINQGKKCSCDNGLQNCDFWFQIVNEVLSWEIDFSSKEKELGDKEAHRNIPKLLIKKQVDNEYVDFNEKVFHEIKKHTKGTWLLDSSKYISRYLLLSRSKRINIRGIYVIRDVRGVINSFGKQVQTPKSPLTTLVYYLAVNFFAQILFFFDKKVLKVKYEDFVAKPEEVLERIYSHVFETTETAVISPKMKEFYEMPHIVGGNRMKTNKKIAIGKDEKWKENLNRIQRIKYYLLALPFMVLNKYKI